MSIRPGEENIQVLYKFRPMVAKDPSGSTAVDNFTNSLFQDGEVFFPPPASLNDPFDSKMVYDSQASVDEMKVYFQAKGFSGDQVAVIMEKIANGHLSISAFIPKQDPDILRIFCATKNNNSILMWSHYAVNHTGICIGFRVHKYQESLCLKIHPDCVLPVDSALAAGDLPFTPVTYSSNRPKAYNIFTSTADDVKPFLITKEQRWEYESEYRILLFTRVILKNPIIIDTGEIVEVIFGVNTPGKLIDDVKKILSGYPNRGKHIKLLKAKLSSQRYEIDFDPA